MHVKVLNLSNKLTTDVHMNYQPEGVILTRSKIHTAESSLFTLVLVKLYIVHILVCALLQIK